MYKKQVWNYYVRRYYSHYGSNWTESFDPVDSKEVALQGGKGSVAFDLNDWGYYRLRVVSDKTKQFSTVPFYAYGGRVDMVSAVRPSLIKLTLDKALYTIGETATLKVESPFDGQGIVTVQGDSLEDMIPVTIENNVGQIQLPVTEAHFPNVWLEVTVIHTVESGKTQMHPFSSFALASVNVENPARKLAVAFSGLPEEVRPAGQREFTVQVADHTGNPVEAEVTLVAVGFKPNSRGIGLEEAGVETDQRGFVTVDEQMRTNVPGIWAIGDLTGKLLLAHTASAMGILCAEAIAGLETKPIDYRMIPRATYSTPQVASFGWTEPQAKEAGLPVNLGKFYFMANGKALGLNEYAGYVKIITHERSGEILGASIVGLVAGPGAVTEVCVDLLDMLVLFKHGCDR